MTDPLTASPHWRISDTCGPPHAGAAGGRLSHCRLAANRPTARVLIRVARLARGLRRVGRRRQHPMVIRQAAAGALRRGDRHGLPRRLARRARPDLGLPAGSLRARAIPAGPSRRHRDRRPPQIEDHNRPGTLGVGPIPPQRPQRHPHDLQTGVATPSQGASPISQTRFRYSVIGWSRPSSWRHRCNVSSPREWAGSSSPSRARARARPVATHRVVGWSRPST
jgi:hypothetical protein